MNMIEVSILLCVIGVLACVSYGIYRQMHPQPCSQDFVVAVPREPTALSYLCEEVPRGKLDKIEGGVVFCRCEARP